MQRKTTTAHDCFLLLGGKCQESVNFQKLRVRFLDLCELEMGKKCE